MNEFKQSLAFYLHDHGLKKAITKVHSCLKNGTFLPTARGAYPALSSILLNIANSIINAVLHRETRMRWAASGAIDPVDEIKPFLALCS